MNNSFVKFRNTFIQNYIQSSYNSKPLSSILVHIISVMASLRNMSYIFEKQSQSYKYVLAVIARPQIVIFVENLQYVILAISVIYIILSQLKYSSARIIGNFGQLMYLGLINFFFEISRGPFDYLTQIILICIFIFEFFIVNGTLNIGSKSVFTPKKSLLDFIISVVNIILMYLKQYEELDIILKLVAIANSVITLLYIIFWFPIKNLYIGTIIISIHILTFYLGILQLLFEDYSFITDLIFAAFIVRIIYSQLVLQLRYKPKTLPDLLYKIYQESSMSTLTIEKPTQKQDLIIYASLFAQRRKFYEGVMILHTVKQLNWLTKIKKQIMIKDWLQQMDIKLKTSSSSQSGLSETVEQLIHLEDQNVTIQTKIIGLIKSKCSLMLAISQKQKIDFSQLLSFNKSIVAVQESLEKQYAIFPNQKTQNILSFLYSEILNEFLLASQLKVHLTKTDDKQSMPMFSNKMVYLITSYNSQEVLIKRASNNAAALFKINHNNLIQKNIGILIPPGIREQHLKLIKKFLVNGQSKYMRRLDKNYFYNKIGFMQSVEFALDISFTSEEINFITFMEPYQELNMALVLDSNCIITSITDSLLSALNINSQTLLDQKISKFLPIFKGPILQNYYEFADFIIFAEKDEATSNSTTTYITSFEISTKIVETEILFYILQFEYFKKSENSVKFTHTETNNSIGKYSISFSENIFIDDPYKYDDEVNIQPTSHQYNISKQTNEVFEQTVHQTQIKDIQHSSRPLFYKTQNKINYSVSCSDQNSQQLGENINSLEENQAVSSQLSTLGFRHSAFYKKYEILNKMHEFSELTANHKIFLFVFGLCLLIQLAFVITQFTETNVSLTNLIADIDLLQIKNFAFQPYESFLVTRWTIFNYNNLLAAGSISKTAHTQLVLFPRSNLPLAFERLQQNMDEVLNKLQLQQFLEDTYLDIQLYLTTNTGEHYNISLRNCIMIMLNYQYLTKMAYLIDGTVNTDSSYIYFQYRNYYVIKTEFGELNKDLLDTTITRSQTILQKLEIIYIASLLFLFLSLLLSFLLYLKIEKSHKSYINLVFCCQTDFFSKDLARLNALSNLIINDYNNLFQYNFALGKKEEFLQKLKEKVTKKDHKKFILEHNDFLSVRNYYNRAFFIIVFIAVLTQASISYGQVKNYLGKYPATATFYQDISDIGTDVPCLYAQSNILYGRATFPYYNADDIAKILSEITNAKNQIYNFTLTTVDFNQYFLSSSFADLYNNIMNEDLCPQLPTDMQEKAKTICSLVMEGQMSRGLLSILIYIVNFIQTEQDINQFTKRLKLSYLELEGAFLASEIVRKLNLELQTDLAIQTDSMIQTITMHSILIMIIIGLFVLFLHIIIKKTLIRRQFLVQRMLYLVPLSTLLFDDGFERNAKTIILRENF